MQVFTPLWSLYARSRHVTQRISTFPAVRGLLGGQLSQTQPVNNHVLPSPAVSGWYLL